MNTRERREQIQEIAKRCMRIVEWDDADKIFVGSAPPMLRQCCHGETEAEVLAQLTEIIHEWAADIADGKVRMPPEVAERTFSGKVLLRMDPSLHRMVAMKAFARGESLNRYISGVIAAA